MSRRVSIAAVATALAFGARVAPARADVVERVAAVVNEQAIFLSDLQQRARPFLGQVARAPNEEARVQMMQQLYGELLSHLVDELLVQQAASRASVTVTAADVERAIRNVMRQSGLSEARFWEAVRQQGFSAREYRLDVRRQLLRLKVLNQRVRGRINITPEDVRDYYNRSVREARSRDTFRASHILLRVPEDAGAARVAAVRARALDIVRRMRAGTPFADLARELSEDRATRASGGDLGELRRGLLPRSLDDALIDLDVGEVAGPIRGPLGFHIVTITDRETTDVRPFREAREQIYREMLEREMGRQEEIWLAELRRAAFIEIRIPIRRARPGERSSQHDGE